MSINWEDSTTYQLIFNRGVEIGRMRTLKRYVLLAGAGKFGPPTEEAEDAIHTLTDRDQLLHAFTLMTVATDWKTVVEQLQKDLVDIPIILESPVN